MPFRSERLSLILGRKRRIVLIAVAILAVVVPISAAAADVISTNLFVVLEGDVQEEDAYVAASSGDVAGTVDGDLVIATPRLTISGVVTGDVFIASQGSVSVSGRIDGSLRGFATSVDVSGSVGDDVAVAALGVDISGDVGRDVILLANDAVIGGSVARDVLGRSRAVVIDGFVGRDVDVTVDSIAVEAGGDVVGDVIYQSSSEIVLDAEGSVGGQVIAIPARAPFFVSLVLRLALALGFLGFLVAGIVVLWIFPRTSEAALAAIMQRPLVVVGIGLASVVAVPLLVALLIATLVGIPLAFLLLFGAALALVFGPIPAVVAAGSAVLGGRGGTPGGFLVGGTVYALVIVWLPVLGSIVAAVGMIVGVGGWLVGAWSIRGVKRWPAVPQRPVASR